MNDAFVVGLAVAVTGGVFNYLFQSIRKTRAIRRALEIEINGILEGVQRTIDYLERDDHYWLEEGRELKRGPTALGTHDKVFSALLSELPAIGPAQAAKVLAFYNYAEFCEGLRASLFDHIRSHAQSQTPLTAADVRILRERRQRLIDAYRILSRAYVERLPIGLSQLRECYDRPEGSRLTDALRECA